MSDQNPYGDSSYGQHPNGGAPGGAGGGGAYGTPQVPPPYQETIAAQPGYGFPQQAPPPPYQQAGPPQQPQQAGGGWQHGGGSLPQAAGATLLTIGDIAITEQGVMTPAGQLPLRGAVWTVSDMSRSESKTPTYAVVLAIIFALACLVGLLFLLIKENVTTGYVQVTVNSGGKFHATMLPVRNPNDVYAITQQVNYARTLSA